MPATAPTTREVLEAAAKQFQLVLRQEGDYLLARNRAWPDRDEEETPAPYPERWIAAKARGEGLSVEEMAVMGRLPDARLAGLGAYRDGNVHFAMEVEFVLQSRWIWPLIETLSAGHRKAAESRNGLPVRSLDLRQRTYLISSVGKQAPWQEVRLYLTKWGETAAKGEGAFAEARLALPGSETPVWAVALQSQFGRIAATALEKSKSK